MTMEKTRILIVEDEAIIALEIENQLQSLGYEVISIVDNGEKAIKKAVEDKPDLILMDIRIKGEIDGIDTAKAIRSQFGIPVIFLTAYLDEERIERAKITMPFGYVLKPIQERDLKVTLDMALYVAKVDAERKLVEEKLRESEERLRLSTEIANVAVWQYDVLKNQMSLSTNHAALYGVKQQDIWMKETFLDAIHPDDREISKQIIQNSIIPGGSDNYQFDFRVIWPDGSVHWLFMIGQVTKRDQNGSAMIVQGCLMDITERKQMEETSKKQKDIFELVINSVPMRIFWKDLNSVYLGCNTNFAKAAGKDTIEDIISKDDFDMVWSKDAQKFINDDRQVMKTGTSKLMYEEDYFDINGNKTWWRTSKMPLKDSAGNILGLLATSEDITQHKNSEEKQKQNEQLLREIIDNMEKAIAIYEPIDGGKDFRFVDTNEFAESIMHYKTEDVVGKTIKELFPGEASVGLSEKLRETYLTEKSTSIPLKQYQDDRITQWVENFIFKLPSGKVVAMFEDTFEQRKVEEALQESEEKFRAIFEKAVDGVLVADTKTREFTMANESLCNMMGYELEEILNLSVDDIHPKDDLPRVIEAFEKQLKQEFLTARDIPVQRKNGTVFFADINSTPVSIGGSLYLIGIVRDITERKQVEEQIKASLKEKETLLQEIHHRVKNNMQVISSLLKLQSNNVEDSQIKGVLKESESRVYAMSAVHESLHGSEKLSEIDLKSYLFKIITFIFQTYATDHRKIKLNSNVENAPISINQAYPLGLIVNELISNSLKYAFPDKKEGEITVTMKKLEKELELIVRDDGIGMAKEFDLKNLKSLGLKLVRTLVENQLNGSVNLDNTNGTKFTIKFNTET